jgi:hypothetical protein
MTVRDPGKRLSEAWLNHRFELFDRFCLPSVRGQTNQQFKWLVFYDSQTPERFAQRLYRYAEWSNLRPVPLDVCNLENIRRAIASCGNPLPEYLLTTRLDNDDAIHESFVDVVQKQFTRQAGEAINITHGYQLYGKKAYYRRHWGNPFISLIERSANPATVFARNHDELGTIAHIKQIKDFRGWAQIIHQNNAFNQVHGIRCPLIELSDGFKPMVNAIGTVENQVGLRCDQIITLLRTVIRRLKRAL